MFIKFIARGQDIRIHFPLNVIRSVAESESSLLISHLNSASACKITIYSGNDELHFPISPIMRRRVETESDSGFEDSNQIPVFQGLGIDSDPIFGIVQMIRQGFI